MIALIPYIYTHARTIWKEISANILCIQVNFGMLAISFYFVKCVIISCKLSLTSRFTCNQISDNVISRFSKGKRQN